MKELVYPSEKILGKITLFLGLIAWLLLIVGTFGSALIVLLFGFLLYLFAQSALISYIKGNGVELSAEQFPDLYAQFIACCNKLEIKTPPQAYILNGNGGLNAFATQFLGAQYVILYSDVVDAMDKNDDGVRFYIGHELGHLRMNHLTGQLLRWPVLWLPLLGAAYSRARESTCDRHGLACCTTPENAALSLAALATGAVRWQQLNVKTYLSQAQHTTGFWMSFHELIAAYPWLTKRVARVLHSEEKIPKRNPFAYLIAIFVPFAGRLGSGFAFIILIYIVAVLAAVAIPAYKDYTSKAKLDVMVRETKSARDALALYYNKNDAVPASLEIVGLAKTDNKITLELDTESMELTAENEVGTLIFTPLTKENGDLYWTCAGDEDIRPTQLPASCVNLHSQ